MTAAQIIETLAQGIIGAIPQLLEALPQVLSAMIDTIMATDWLEVGKQVVLAIGEGSLAGFPSLAERLESSLAISAIGALEEKKAARV